MLEFVYKGVNAKIVLCEDIWPLNVTGSIILSVSFKFSFNQDHNSIVSSCISACGNVCGTSFPGKYKLLNITINKKLNINKYFIKFLIKSFFITFLIIIDK